MAFSVTSSVFTNGGPIPPKYTCDGEDVSPPLILSRVPYRTETLVLIMDDPDAPTGTWDHWILFNLPPHIGKMLVGMADDLPLGTGQALNSWGRIGYGGPCPLSGTHRYYFRLYALDTALQLKDGVTREDVVQAMDGHVLAETEIMGTYSR